MFWTFWSSCCRMFAEAFKEICFLFHYFQRERKERNSFIFVFALIHFDVLELAGSLLTITPLTFPRPSPWRVFFFPLYTFHISLVCVTRTHSSVPLSTDGGRLLSGLERSRRRWWTHGVRLVLLLRLRLSPSPRTKSFLSVGLCYDCGGAANLQGSNLRLDVSFLQTLFAE